MSRLYHFEEAKTSYQAAALSLPAADPMIYLQGASDLESTWSMRPTSSTESEVFGCYGSSLNHCPSSPHSGTSSASSVESSDLSQDRTIKMPSPLRFQKLAAGSFETTCERAGNSPLFHTDEQSPFTPPLANRPSSIHGIASSSSSTNSTHRTAAWLRYLAYERYNTLLTTFAEMLSKHISTVETLIQITQEAQARKTDEKHRMSYDASEAARVADMKARIVRLKTMGWKRERFRPERYQELCECALEEL